MNENGDVMKKKWWASSRLPGYIGGSMGTCRFSVALVEDEVNCLFTVHNNHPGAVSKKSHVLAVALSFYLGSGTRG
jgi:hypothetical protein